MKLIATMPARNEDWIIGFTLRALLMWVDEAVVLNHASEDGTNEVLARISAEQPGRLMVLTESDPTWYEMAHRQRMLEAARSRGASHVVLIDSDECLTGNLLPEIRGHIESLPPGQVLSLPWLYMVRSPHQWKQCGAVSMAFHDAPNLGWRQRDGYDFHHRHPIGSSQSKPNRFDGGVMHYQFTRWRGFLAKQALYKMTEVIRWPNRDRRIMDAMYSQTVHTASRARTSAVPVEWYRPYERIMQHFIVDDNVPTWQEKECRRLWAEHGPDKFRGLDLFGVMQ